MEAEKDAPNRTTGVYHTIIECMTERGYWQEAIEWTRQYLPQSSQQKFCCDVCLDEAAYIAKREYYAQCEDFSPNTETPLETRRLDSFEDRAFAEMFIKELIGADRHGYAMKELRAYQSHLEQIA
jgi:hypothetical protein